MAEHILIACQATFKVILAAAKSSSIPTGLASIMRYILVPVRTVQHMVLHLKAGTQLKAELRLCKGVLDKVIAEDDTLS